MINDTPAARLAKLLNNLRETDNHSEVDAAYKLALTVEHFMHRLLEIRREAYNTKDIDTLIDVAVDYAADFIYEAIKKEERDRLSAPYARALASAALRRGD